jgi:predicted acyl esterase
MKAHFQLYYFPVHFGNSQTQQLETFVKDNFTKKEFYIPMRDGTKLFTAVYIPKDISNKNKYPFLMQKHATASLLMAKMNTEQDSAPILYYERQIYFCVSGCTWKIYERRNFYQYDTTG